MTFDVEVRERILRKIDEVFDAVVDPAKMINYFISGASGPIEEGAHVTWEFADVGPKVAIDVLTVNRSNRIAYKSSALGRLLRTTIEFEADGPSATAVTVTDASFALNEGGIKFALGRNAGWTLH